jgi:hypothetical protein
MKKLIASSVVFALITGAAFAQAVSASVETRMLFAQGSTEGDGTAKFGTGVHNGAIGFGGGNDDGTYGGVFKLAFLGADFNGTRDDLIVAGTKFDRAFIWWKPIDMLTFKLGHDGDGQWGTTDLIRWGHFNMPRNLSVERWNQHGYLLGHWDQSGFSVAVTPIDNFFFNFAIGFEGTAATSLEDYFKDDARLEAQAGYTLDGIGKFVLTYARGAGMWPINTNVGRIGLTYSTSDLVEGLSLEVGGNYKLDDGAKDAIRAALGVHYNGGDFGAKFRATFQNGEDFSLVYVDLLPWYNISDGIGTIYCNIMFAITGEETKAWHVNPYLRNSMGGSGDWRIGALIQGEIEGFEGIKWKLATSWVLSF